MRRFTCTCPSRFVHRIGCPFFGLRVFIGGVMAGIVLLLGAVGVIVLTTGGIVGAVAVLTLALGVVAASLAARRIGL